VTQPQPQVVLLFGRPGVGKLTVGRELAARTSYRLLHNHAVVDLAETLFAFGSPPFVAMRERLWLQAVDAVLAESLPGLILTFAPERTVSDHFLADLADHVENGGSRLRMVELVCSSEQLELRLLDPSRKAFGKLRDPERYRQSEANGDYDRPVMPTAEITVDTSEMSAAEAALRIVDGVSTSADGVPTQQAFGAGSL